MLDELTTIQQEVLAQTPTTDKRYLYEKINWNTRALCLIGGRGVGKTTLMCQALLEHYPNPKEALYFSADNIVVASKGLFEIARDFFKYGGKALFIDEIHKYENWSVEIKNIIDTYRHRQIVFSASSSVDLHRSKADLSRRVVYYPMKGLSFREYLLFTESLKTRVFTLDQLFSHHMEFCTSFKGMPILKYFHEYLMRGYFPFFLEDQDTYLSKLNNVIEKIIFEDIAVVYNLKQPTLYLLKKLLWLIATSVSFSPNVDSLSKNLGVSREVIYNSFEYLERGGLINNVYPHAKGIRLARKPGKVFLENTNLLNVINGALKFESEIGNVRETFFVNQCHDIYSINLHETGDFLLDEKYIIEVGGKSKNFKQIGVTKNSYLVLDDIEIGFDRKIPLYLFGFFY